MPRLGLRVRVPCRVGGLLVVRIRRMLGRILVMIMLNAVSTAGGLDLLLVRVLLGMLRESTVPIFAALAVLEIRLDVGLIGI